MLITNHVLAGAIVGTLSRHTGSAFAGGVAAHFFLDSLPHAGFPGRRNFLTTAVLDGLVGATAMTVIAVRTPKERRRRVVAGMVGSCLPDANKPCREVFGSSPFPAFVEKFHHAIQIESPGKLGQELVVASLLAPAVAGLTRAEVSVPRRRRPVPAVARQAGRVGQGT